MSASDYNLLSAFRGLFDGKIYKHRDPSLGDYVASCLYEDLYRLGRSRKLRSRIEQRSRVVNAQNKTVGIARRRGDGTFGELVPAAVAITAEGFVVSRGPVATIEIGAETKILAKAMIKQIDRVTGDLIRQTQEFRKRGGHPICVALVGVNYAQRYRKLRTLSAGYNNRRRVILMSFRFFGSSQPTKNRSRFLGWMRARL